MKKGQWGIPVAVLALGAVAYFLFLRKPGTTPADFRARIAAARSKSELQDIRYGAYGFEIAYTSGKLSHDEYLGIFSAYEARYVQLP